MPKYVFWYKKEIKAKSFDHAVSLEKQERILPRFDSIRELDEDSERQLESCIGFAIPTDDDYEDDWVLTYYKNCARLD